MYSVNEIPEKIKGPATVLMQHFDQGCRGLTLDECIYLAGHIYETAWAAYIQEVASQGQGTPKTVEQLAKMQEKLTTALVHWARAKGKENGHNSTNLIQIPGG